MPDYLDRPRQIVHHEQGKEAITEYEVLERIDAPISVWLSIQKQAEPTSCVCIVPIKKA